MADVWEFGYTLKRLKLWSWSRLRTGGFWIRSYLLSEVVPFLMLLWHGNVFPFFCFPYSFFPGAQSRFNKFNHYCGKIESGVKHHHWLNDWCDVNADANSMRLCHHQPGLINPTHRFQKLQQASKPSTLTYRQLPHSQQGQTIQQLD